MPQEMNDGGPAFPRPSSTEYLDGPDQTNCTHSDGMSLRDWFAGQAMAGLCESGVEADYDEAHIAATCWRLADAILAERAKKPPEKRIK